MNDAVGIRILGRSAASVAAKLNNSSRPDPELHAYGIRYTAQEAKALLVLLVAGSSTVLVIRYGTGSAILTVVAFALMH